MKNPANLNPTLTLFLKSECEQWINGWCIHFRKVEKSDRPATGVGQRSFWKNCNELRGILEFLITMDATSTNLIIRFVDLVIVSLLDMSITM